MDRRAQAYIGRVIALVLAFAGVGVMLVMLGESWWQLLTAVVFGVLFTQVAFLSHDAAHQQVFSNGRRNEWLSRIIGNGIVGLSYAWWAKKHGKHHANPNTVGKDGDIEPGFIAFIPEDAEKRTGFAAWFARRQGWMLFPLLTMFGWALHVSAVDAVIRATKVKHRGTEAALLAVRLIGFPLLVIWAMGPLVGLAFIAVQVAVFGVYMGASFAPNHKGMPVIPKDSKVDFLQRQILTARNIRGGRLIDWGMGGLNFQIEHHIFPACPAPTSTRSSPSWRSSAPRSRSPTPRPDSSSHTESSSATSTMWGSDRPTRWTAPSSPSTAPAAETRRLRRGCLCAAPPGREEDPSERKHRPDRTARVRLPQRLFVLRDEPLTKAALQLIQHGPRPGGRYPFEDRVLTLKDVAVRGLPRLGLPAVLGKVEEILLRRSRGSDQLRHVHGCAVGHS